MVCDTPSGKRDRTLRLLLLEDGVADAARLKQQFDQAGIPVIAERVESREGFTRALEEFGPDIALSNHAGTPFGALAALEVLQNVRPTAPLIVIASALDEAAVVALVRAGVADLVHTSNLSRLTAAVEGALALRRPLRALSPRQLEVLRLVALGHTTGDIARRLKLSVKTVEAHRAEVMRRLDIHNLAGLVRFAVRVGLISAAS
jgi:DNA-binding NarL/FixJ family response regulator